MTEAPAFAPLGMRKLSGGAILPSLDDRIINDVRDGYSLPQLCERQRCNAEVALAIVTLAEQRGFLFEFEANRVRREG